MAFFRKPLLRGGLAFFLVGTLAGCGKSPESAAEEVCACMSKITKSQDVGAMAGKLADCQEIAASYRGKYTGKDLNTFTRTLTNCTVGR